MTQTQRRPSRKIQLEAGQVYIKRPLCGTRVQTLVDGYPDWSYLRYQLSWEEAETFMLHYKGRYVISLKRVSDGPFLLSHPTEGESDSYTDLAAVASHYVQTKSPYLNLIEQWNREEGLEEWALTESFTTATLNVRLTVPQQERQRMELLARAAHYTDFNDFVNTFALAALYARLPEIEALYTKTTNAGGDEQA